MELSYLAKLKNISKLGYIAIRRPFMIRNKAAVLDEYETSWEKYNDILTRCDTLESWLYLKGIEDIPRICNVDSRICYTHYNMPQFNRSHLVKTLSTEFKNSTSITEFGSGLGRNLLFIKKNFPHIACYGYELCSHGVAIAKKACQKFNLDVEYSQLDFVNDDENKYIFPKTDLAFTMYALEQVARGNKIAMQNILNHVKQGSIHIEPVVENYPLTIRGIIGKIDHYKVDYLRNFEKNLTQISNVAFVKTLLGTAHNPLMYPSLYCVKKV